MELAKINKNGKIFLCFLICFLLIYSCKSSFTHKFEKKENVILIYKDSLTIKIELIDESIVHIKKYIGKEDTSIENYVTILPSQNIDWKIKEKRSSLIIETSMVDVLVSKEGDIRFFSKDGKLIVKESSKGSSIKMRNNYEISQSFAALNEGLYGLGQFQSGVMNWKNVPVRLEQYNQEIAVPFLVSTKGYGLYWHNYSVTDVNYPKNEIHFNKKKNNQTQISKANFTPKQTGIYHFFVDSKNENRSRKNGEVMVSINSDTIINYNTVWVPSAFSVAKFLQKGISYAVSFSNTKSNSSGKLLYNTPNYNKTVFSSKFGKAIDYYFIYEGSPKKVISSYHNLTGKAPMFPKTAFGFWQCRERYKSQNELLDNAKEYRKRKIPIDNIVQDWNYWPLKANGPEWDRTRYPNPKKMIQTLDSLHLRLMVSIWPELRNKKLIEKYQFSKNKLGHSYYLDFYNPIVRNQYYKMVSDSMFNIGVSSIWLDGTEPGIHPKKGIKTLSNSFEEVFNSYALLVNKAIYEGKRNEFPNQRVFNLTRSAFAGQQRYGAASWSGDVKGTWEQFEEQIPAGLNFVMAGIPYWTTDIGGFFRDQKSLNPEYDNQYTNPEYIELLTRWFQYGAFNPIFRIHGFKSDTEIWRYGLQFENTARNFIDIRYQLLPYIYSESRKVTKEGHLLMSPMVYHYPNDSKTWNIKNQFFFGESILVNPITKYKARSRSVYLPKGNWFNYWTDNKINGNREISVKAPLNQIPLFIKEGTILPIGPKVQYALQEVENSSILLKIYPGKDASYLLYFDDNNSYDYEKGKFSEVNIFYSEEKKTVKLEEGVSNYLDFKKSPQNFKIKVVGKEKPINFIFRGNPVTIKL